MYITQAGFFPTGMYQTWQQKWSHFRSMVIWLVCSFRSLMAQATGSPAAWASLTIIPISVQSTWLASALRTTCSALSTTGKFISTSSPFIRSTSCEMWGKLCYTCVSDVSKQTHRVYFVSRIDLLQNHWKSWPVLGAEPPVSVHGPSWRFPISS